MKKQLTKQELRDKQEKKQRILMFVKRSINIVCYCLSVLFLILCVAVGVQSCNSKNDKQNKSYRTPLNDISLRANFANDDYIYSCLLSVGSQSLSVDFQQNVIGSNLNLSSESSSAQSRRFFNYHFDDGVYIMANNGSYIEVEYFLLSFTSYITRVDSSTNYYSYRMDKVWFRDYSGTDYAIVNYTGTSNIYNQNSYSVLNSMVNRIVSSSYDVTHNYFRSFYFLVDDPLIFYFNDLINYNGYFNASLSAPYISYSTLSTNIDMPFFISGGNVYNQIHLQFTDAYGSHFIDNTGNIYLLNANQNTYMTYLYMEYVNTYTGLTTLVNTRDFGVHFNGTANYNYNLNSSSWVSNNYRELKFIYEPDNLQVNTLTKFNSNTSNVNNGSKYTDVGLGNVFSLLSTSFSALISLFTIQIIPGLTIGLLIFLPLIVTIIILVFKAVKK